MAKVSGSKYGQKHFKKNKPVKLYQKKIKSRDLFVQELEKLKKGYEQIDTTSIETFEQLPLTSQTLKGLQKSKYVKLTDIQKEAIGLALKGHDILGAAKTGSGKTLAFVIPVLECLFREGWSKPNGLGALVITPTRELAYQIFVVFSKVAKLHSFTIGLVIGGKDLAFERKVLNQYNIVICTPGRLLQHMDENPLFDALNLQILVLDEADRILDMGFAKTMDAIIEHLPQNRQTLLFSATQTKSVKDLARLSLKDPKYVSAHEHAKYSTPESLIQSYIVCEAHDKINFLWSFLKQHKRQKTLVFMASCKQVKYTFEAFCRLKPGLSVTALYGSLHQLKRMEIYRQFCNKQHVVMFATDIAARGLDFPNVNWVIQLDCPEDVNTYIHRAGRTARYDEGGESLLVLLPSEKDSMIEQMEARKIPITEIKVNPREIMAITKKLENICSNNQELSQSAQRAFNAYLKSIFLMKDKTIFDVRKINMEAYARSLGLLTTPRTRFITKQLAKQSKSHPTPNTEVKDSENTNQQMLDASDSDCDVSGSAAENQPQEDTSLKCAQSKNIEGEWFLSDEREDDVLNNFKLHEIEEKKTDVEVSKKKPITKAAMVKKILKKEKQVNSKIVFDDEGEVVGSLNKPKAPVVDEIANQMCIEGYSFDLAVHMMAEADITDKRIYKQKINEKHKEKKRKLKKLRQERDMRISEDMPVDIEEGTSISRKVDEEETKRYIKELPDPAKYYGKDSENSDSDVDMEQSDSERLSMSAESMDSEASDGRCNRQILLPASLPETEHPKQKRKKNRKKEMESSCKRPKLSKKAPSSAMDLGVEADLALALLHNS